MYLYMLQNGYNEIMGEMCKNAEWITENKRTNSVTQKNVRKRTSFAHSCKICNGKACSMLKIFAIAKYVRKME